MKRKVVKIRVDCSKIRVANDFFKLFTTVLNLEYWASYNWDAFSDAVYGLVYRVAESEKPSKPELYRIGVFGVKALAKSDPHLGGNIDRFFDMYNEFAEEIGIQYPLFETVTLPFPDADF